MKRVISIVVGLALLAAACTGSGESTAPSTTTSLAPSTTTAPTTVPDGAPLVDPASRTADRLRTVADYDALARDGLGDQSVVKFSITEFSTDPGIVWLDSGFYTLHDEWYWFQLVNGLTVRGFDTVPVDGLSFDSVAELYAWADEHRDRLPLDLRFTTLDRLYSPAFYASALDASADRRIGLGALIRTPDPDTGTDRWVIELEYSDEVTLEQMETYFDVIGASVPDEIAERLQWVPRSRPQEITAAAIELADGPDRDRIVGYDELSNPGDTQVYSSGVAAGRLLVVTDGGRWSLGDAGPDDIVAIDVAPDDLPPGNGLITGTPQTPLAHVNVLALNRGIPNAFLAGLADDPTLDQLGRVRAPVLVSATDDGTLEIIPLTDDEYAGWQAAQGLAPISVSAVDLTTAPYTRRIDDIDTTLDAATLGSLRPLIGGKAVGFVELATPGTVTMPTDALAITVRSYREHEAQFADEIDAVLQHAAGDSSVRSRFLLLEGRDEYDERFPSGADASFADDFTDANADTPLGDVLAGDGLVRLVRSRPIDPTTLSLLTAEIRAGFADLSPTQGLRFRSSSSVEDIEGFNGAGLYDSNTGFVDPELLADSDDHHRTIERAILRTWSSYWSAIAFEERRRENVDHASGAMAVLVHPRFDDELELNNGVATLTIRPEPGTAAVMEVNVQAGAVSVTNATVDDDASPEIVRVVRQTADGDLAIERVASSSIADSDEVLDDEALTELFDQLLDVATTWLARANDALTVEQRSSSITLDFEFRTMDAGWPALLDGTVEPTRIVVKQARSLDPGIRHVPASLLDRPIPRDVLAHAVRIVELSCPDDVRGVSVTTDPLARVDLGHSDRPLVVWADGAAPADADACAASELLTTPRQYLLDLLGDR
jgi:Pyruvate phosphate dikinase, AMP/ATP-binding domain